MHRAGLLRAYAAQDCVPGVRVLAHGPRLNESLVQQSVGWRHLLSVRVVTTAADLRFSLPANRRGLADGLRMTSLFDRAGTTPGAAAMLAGEPPGVYYFTRAPLQMKVVDRREVLLEGPLVDGELCVLAVSDKITLHLAMQYWRALREVAVPGWNDPAGTAGLTPRQRRVADLLRADLTDGAIAETLGVSVRTVRYEVAHILEAVGVRSRFAAGASLAQLASADLPHLPDGPTAGSGPALAGEPGSTLQSAGIDSEQ